MSMPQTSGGYSLGPDAGEALWFNRGLGFLKATADLTDGRFAVLELRAPKGFASPIHTSIGPRTSPSSCSPARSASNMGMI
jgi:hypothetical protein